MRTIIRLCIACKRPGILSSHVTDSDKQANGLFQFNKNGKVQSEFVCGDSKCLSAGVKILKNSGAGCSCGSKYGKNIILLRAIKPKGEVAGIKSHGGTVIYYLLCSENCGQVNISTLTRDEKRICSVCFQAMKKEEANKCASCRQYYCSRECQQVDWPVHKNICNYKPTLSKRKKKKRIAYRYKRNLRRKKERLSDEVD